MSQEGTAPEPSSSEEELSDYREVLSCMRRRFEARGMFDAMDLVEQLDDAISQAITDRRPRPMLRIVK
jgi:hypothetical protein